MLLFITTAFAGHSASTDIEFDRLTRSRGMIEYELDSRSAHQLRRLGVTPTMAIWQDGDLLWSEPLTSREGTVCPPDGMNGRTVQVTLVAFHRGWHIDTINGHEHLEFEGRRDRQSRYAQSNESHRSDHYRDDQRQERPTSSQDITAAIAACDWALWDDDLTLECARAASRSRYDAVALVEACDSAFWDDEDVVECVSSY